MTVSQYAIIWQENNILTTEPFKKYVTCVMAFFMPLTCVTRSQFTLSPSLCYSLKKNKLWNERKEIFYICGLNISIGLWIMPGKKIELCPTKAPLQRAQLSGVMFKSHQRLKTQKHSFSKGQCCFGFSFYEHFSRQFTYAVFFILKTVSYVWM